jgi:hypothetical protein
LENLLAGVSTRGFNFGEIKSGGLHKQHCRNLELVNLLNVFHYTENRFLCPHAQTTLQPTVFLPVLESIPHPFFPGLMKKLTASGHLSAEIKLLQEIIRRNVLCLPSLRTCLLKLQRNVPHMTGKF